MRWRISQIVYLLLLLGGVVFLGRLDYASKLETDVSSLLPDVETEQARLVRSLISENQGRVVYAELAAEADPRAFVEQVQASPLVASVIQINNEANAGAVQWIGQNRMSLLFPQWWAQKRYEYRQLGLPDADFPEWAAQAALRAMDVFLESPEALELARPELMDPLLLDISALLQFSEERPPAAEAATDAPYYYVWIELAASPLEPATQEAFAELMQQAAAGARFDYGGLVKLAGASRERIQQDVFKINVLSFAGVLLVAVLLLGNPLKLALALPTLLAGAIGALALSFLVFNQVNVIVLIVGAILIGTAIDYAIHMLYAGPAEDRFPSRKLVGLACFSTVCGFMILLCSNLALVRQIGVFVGGGLFSAYLAALLFIRRATIRVPKWGQALTAASGSVRTIVPLALAVLLGVVGLWRVRWHDDIRQLEAPDEALVQADLRLRERIGLGESGRAVILTIGDSYLDLVAHERALQAAAMEAAGASAAKLISIAGLLPSRLEVGEVLESAELLPEFFDCLQARFEDEGYDADAFAGFYDEASRFQQDFQASGLPLFEQRIVEFVDRLQGPLGQSIGVTDAHYWSMSSLDILPEEAQALVQPLPASSVFSQLSFLNQALEDHRGVLIRYGIVAMALVALIVLLFLGLSKGFWSILYPLLGGIIALSATSAVFGSLNMFHLIGCFLGGAIALDYALFSIEAFSRGKGVPFSVWLSAGTTMASFCALSFSAIPVVQSLGVMVASITGTTLLLLHGSRRFLNLVFTRNAD